ncbi:hypothetical protein KJ359_000568 [Pestalotiopsis sp. 9143b]|nr:hypothetical protein KJ359_000568 [Pestalotiopsis sp. 9143b]
MPHQNSPHHVKRLSQRSIFVLRSSTDPSVMQRSSTMASTITLSKPPVIDYVKGTVNAYNLNWKELREWLVTQRFKDYPELVDLLAQEDDFKAINKLRRRATQIDRTARQTNSPDPQYSDDD